MVATQHSLQEISGIAYVTHNNDMACIQDEKGKLFIVQFRFE